jgi:hypothetical protein
MKSGDEMFTPQAIAASNERLERFLDEIDAVGTDYSARAVRSSSPSSRTSIA